MSDTTALLMHYSNIVTGERLAIGFMLIALFGMFTYREDRRSTKFLAVTMVVEVFRLLCDSIAFSANINGDGPLWLMNTVYFVSYTFGYVTLAFFGLYVYSFIKEKTSVGKWFFCVPLVCSLAGLALLCTAIFSGKLFAQVDGQMTEVGTVPVIAQLIQLALIAYFPCAAFTKRKYIGLKSVFLLGLFGLLPGVVMFINYDYSMMCTAYSLSIVYILVQCDTSAAKEKQKQQLETLNRELTAANEEKLAQIEEITSLNSQLEENQAQLEEASAEQEAQLEEISALNLELESARNLADSANEAKSTFLFNMSHDIRTPMNAILGFTKLIDKTGSLSEQQADYLHKIETSGEYLLSVINNVLDMARIESGKVELDEVFTDLLNEDNKTDAMLTSEFLKKNLTFTSDIDVQHRYVYADTFKTRQVTMNLLSNAIKYTPEGGKIHCSFREVPCDRDGYARFVTVISDTGIGMSKEFIEHIFESFSREKTSTENKAAGTGLGMAIVKKLVDLMGGTIEVESELGKGSKFTITADFRIVENPELFIDKQQAEQSGIADLSGKRILLAEDNDLNAEIAELILEETGAAIERAEDGIICVNMMEKANAGYYDLILMDIQMPNMDGYKATEKIRRLPDKEKAGIPIIAMTANAFEEDKREALRAGMNGHLAKPINAEELMNTLSAILEQ